MKKPKADDRWGTVAALRRASGMDFDEAPERAFTVEEYIARYKCLAHTARNQLREWAIRGELVQGWRRVTTRSGQIRKVRCYWKP